MRLKCLATDSTTMGSVSVGSSANRTGIAARSSNLEGVKYSVVLTNRPKPSFDAIRGGRASGSRNYPKSRAGRPPRAGEELVTLEGTYARRHLHQGMDATDRVKLQWLAKRQDSGV